MSEKNQPFIINDRRKFTAEGDLRPDAPPDEPRAAVPPPPPAPEPTAEADPEIPPPPTAEQVAEVLSAYQATTDRLDTAVRAANPSMGPIPQMTFERFMQSVYMNAMMQLGAAAPEGQEPRLDLMGARQTIDMLGMLAVKTKGNLTEAETRFLDTGLFELRMAFLEVTQALSQAAAAKGIPGTGLNPTSGPTLIR